MGEWTTINISKDLLEEVKKTVGKSKLWINDKDFIREAIRDKLAKIQAQECELEAK